MSLDVPRPSRVLTSATFVEGVEPSGGVQVDSRQPPEMAHQALRALPAAGGEGLVELLWNERQVESFGLTHRIAVPLAGRPFRGSTTALAGLLTAWWSQPGRLSNGTAATFVDAEITDTPLAPPQLVITVTTDAPVSAAQVANLRTIRDLRRAVRDLRRASPVTTVAGLALL